MTGTEIHSYCRYLTIQNWKCRLVPLSDKGQTKSPAKFLTTPFTLSCLHNGQTFCCNILCFGLNLFLNIYLIKLQIQSGPTDTVVLSSFKFYKMWRDLVTLTLKTNKCISLSNHQSGGRTSCVSTSWCWLEDQMMEWLHHGSPGIHGHHHHHYFILNELLCCISCILTHTLVASLRRGLDTSDTLYLLD